MSICNVLVVLLGGMIFTGCSGSTPNPPMYKKLGYEKNLVYSKTWKQPINKKVQCKMLMEGYASGGKEKSAYTVTWDGSCANGKAQGLGKLTSNGKYGSGYEIGYVKDGISESYFYSKNLGTNEVKFGRYVRKDGKMSTRYVTYGTVKQNGQIDKIYFIGKKSDSLDMYNGMGMIYSKENIVKKNMGLFGKEIFLGGSDFIENSQISGTWLGYTNLKNYMSYSYGVYSKNRKNKYINIKEGISQKDKVPQSVINLALKTKTKALSQVNIAGVDGKMALMMKKKYDSLHHKNNHNANARESKKTKSINSQTNFQKDMQAISFD